MGDNLQNLVLEFDKTHVGNAKIAVTEKFVYKCALSIKVDLLHREALVAMVLRNILRKDHKELYDRIMKLKYIFIASAVFDPSTDLSTIRTNYELIQPNSYEPISNHIVGFKSPIHEYVKLHLPCIKIEKIKGITLREKIIEFRNSRTQEEIEKERKNIKDELASFVEDLYEIHKLTGFVHNDLHTKNVLVDQKGNYKIIDYGRSSINDLDGAFEKISEILNKSWLYSGISKRFFDTHARLYRKTGEFGFWADIAGFLLRVCLDCGIDTDERDLDKSGFFSNLTWNIEIAKLQLNSSISAKRSAFDYGVKFAIDYISNMAILDRNVKYVFGMESNSQYNDLAKISNEKNSIFFLAGPPWKDHLDTYSKGAIPKPAPKRKLSAGQMGGAKINETAMQLLYEDQSFEYTPYKTINEIPKIDNPAACAEECNQSRPDVFAFDLNAAFEQASRDTASCDFLSCYALEMQRKVSIPIEIDEYNKYLMSNGGSKPDRVRFSGRSYKIRIDKDNAKYIVRKTNRIYLKDIKGRYRYARD